MATFALGTAAGDLAASTFGLGYFGSAVLFALPGLACWRLHLNPIFAFWSAYVLTRPLGATVADWLGKPVLGGLGLGDGPVAAVLGVLIVVCVVYLTRSRSDVSPAAQAVQVRSYSPSSAGQSEPNVARSESPTRIAPEIVVGTRRRNGLLALPACG